MWPVHLAVSLLRPEDNWLSKYSLLRSWGPHDSNLKKTASSRVWVALWSWLMMPYPGSPWVPCTTSDAGGEPCWLGHPVGHTMGSGIL